LDLEREEVKKGRESCILRSFIICTLLQVSIIRVIKSRRMRWAACMTHTRNACKILIGKPGGKRSCSRPGCRCKNYINIKTDFEEIV
jgi:hypothetical protein